MKNSAQAIGGAARSQQQFNPFAKALAETEHSAFDQVPSTSNPFSEALSKTGNSLSRAFDTPSNQSDLLAEQKKALLADQEKELLRKKLHDQVNPVDTTEIFAQEELKTQKALEKLREDLVLLIEDIKHIHNDLSVATQQRVVSPGRSGAYHYNFFRQFHDFIILVRKQVRSASTWIHTANGKQAKRTQRQGLSFAGNETKTVHDMTHHERKSAFAGG